MCNGNFGIVKLDLPGVVQVPQARHRVIGDYLHYGRGLIPERGAA